MWRRYNFKIEDVKKIKVDTIENIIYKYCDGTFPDLLSLDVEGLDEQILKSINFESTAPTIIVVETIEFSTTYKENLKRKNIMYFLQNKGYIAYADIMINKMFAKKDKLI